MPARRSHLRTVATIAAVFVVLGALWGATARTAPAADAARVEPPPVARMPSFVADGARRVGSIAADVVRRAQPPRAGTTCGPARGRVIRFRVEVGHGVPALHALVARDVVKILCDQRGWTASQRVRFRYDPRGRVRVRVLSADATERRCLALTGKSVNRTYSCAGYNEAVLNADRWTRGSPRWSGTVGRYRALMVNHEVGHVLGQRHRGCARGTGPAPVMMQQSKGLGGCTPNEWPLDYEVRSIR